MTASARALRLSPLVRAARTLAEGLGADAGWERTETADEAPAASSRLGLPRRVLAPWRTQPAVASANGSAPEGGAVRGDR